MAGLKFRTNVWIGTKKYKREDLDPKQFHQLLKEQVDTIMKELSFKGKETA